MMNGRRPFIVASLDDHHERMYKAWLDQDQAIFIKPRFFQSAIHRQVDVFGNPLGPEPETLEKHLYGEWFDSLKRPLAPYEYPVLSTAIWPQEITEQAYDGSEHSWQEFDEIGLWELPWKNLQRDLSASVSKLLHTDTWFNEDFIKLQEWLKTRGKPIYLTGSEYHNLTNIYKYRHGLLIRSRRYGETFFNASFKTY
jgi:hypothetical protein